MKRHVRGRAGGRDEFGWSAPAQSRVTPSLTSRVRVEDDQRPALGGVRRERVATFGANLDLVPGRVRLLFEQIVRRSGPRQMRANTALAQRQVRW